MAKPPKNQPPAPREPGTDPVTNAATEPEELEQGGGTGESDPDAAVLAAQAGKARKISKNRAPVAPSPVLGDPDRPAEAPVNQVTGQMSHAEASRLASAPREIAILREEFASQQGEVMALRGQIDVMKSAAPSDDPDVIEGHKAAIANAEEQLAALVKRGNDLLRKIGELSKLPKLTRSVLTEQGWVFPDLPEPPKATR